MFAKYTIITWQTPVQSPDSEDAKFILNTVIQTGSKNKTWKDYSGAFA